MTLEDFFTLTEMNNGLTAPSRVRELMAVMQREKDYIVKNSADSTRQWSAVANAIAATDNKECLDIFIQLDGLHFISEWLKDAQKFCSDNADGFVEESISHLLSALKKLHVEYEKLIASEIWATVQDLLAHNSLKVRDEARALSESWRMNGDCDAAIADCEKSRNLTDDEAAEGAEPESTLADNSVSKETSKDKNLEMTRDDKMLSTSPDDVHTGELESAQGSNKLLDSPVMKKASDQTGSPSSPRPSVEPSCHSVGTAIEPCNLAVSKLDALNTLTEINDSKSPSSYKQSPKTESSPLKLGLVKESKPPDGRILSLSSDSAYQMEPAVEASSLKTSVAQKKGSCDDPLSDEKVTGDYNDSSCMLPKSSSSEKIHGSTKDLGTSILGSKGDGKANSPVPKIGGLASIYNFGKKEMNRKPDRTAKKSGLEIDYGIYDPLEVARQVAIEVVESEIVNCKERSGGSSEKLPEHNMQQSDSPDYMSRKQSSHANEGSLEEEGNGPECSDKSSSPMQQDSTSSLGNLDGEQVNNTRDLPNSRVSAAAQEEANLEKGPCGFDLNEEVFSEDTDHPGSQNLTPISTVAASRAEAAAPALPGAPLQFEGNLGWKGSAATSAFRRASPRRMLENDKDPYAMRVGSSSKQPVCLDIDLNVGESVATREGGALLDTHGSVFPGLPSGESSLEVNARRTEHLELDLNCAGEDGGMPSDWRMQQFFPHGHYSHSSASSKQPVRNINLNDQPSFLNDSSGNCHLSMASQNRVKSDDSVISIMGKRVEVNRRDFISPTPSSSNGQTSDLSFDVNLGRTGGFLGIGSALPYTHSSVYSYNNITPAPTMPFSSVYGSAGPFPAPYMVDSRGTPVVPQIVGSASVLPTAFSQPPFVVNMNGFSPSNGIRPLHSAFDVNSGTLLESSSSKDPAGFGLFLNSTHVQSVDEQLRSHSQPTMTSALNGKRKEPDNGWEQYPFKPYMPPWKHT